MMAISFCHLNLTCFKVKPSGLGQACNGVLLALRANRIEMTEFEITPDFLEVGIKEKILLF